MANLFTLQDHLEVIKTGSPDQKNRKLTPESIADVRNFIAKERANRNAGTNYGLESQFHEWEDLIKKFEWDRQVITTNTATATSWVRDRSPVSVTPVVTVAPVATVTSTPAPFFVPVASPVSVAPNEWPRVAPSLQEFKRKLEQENNSPMTVASLQKILDSLKTEVLSDARAILMNLAWSRLASGGFITSIQEGRIVVQNAQDTPLAAAFASTLNNQLNTTFPLSEIQSAILTGTGKFWKYTETQLWYPEKASLREYVDFLTRPLALTVTEGSIADKVTINASTQLTPTEKAFLISYIDGGYAGYSIAPDISRSIELKKQQVELLADPQYVAISAKVDTISNGAAQKERVQMQEQWGPQTEMTMESFMANPTEAIVRYPWTALTLLIGWIWKFGFMKTIWGVLVGMVGIKAINELGGTKLGGEIKAGLNKWAKAAWEAATEAIKDGRAAVAGAWAAVAEATKPVESVPNVPNTPIEVSGLDIFQKAGVLSIENNTSLVEDISNYPKQSGKERQNADLNTYMWVLHLDSIQNMTLDRLIYTRDHEQSIFSDTVKSQFWDNKAIPDTVSRYLLKKMIRSYIWFNESLSLPIENRKEWEQSLEGFKQKFPEAQWKNKTLKNLVGEVYKK